MLKLRIRNRKEVMKMFDEKAFRELVSKRGFKLKADANALGIESSSLYRKMKGQLDFTRSEIQKCCDFFGLEEMNNIFFAKQVT